MGAQTPLKSIWADARPGSASAASAIAATNIRFGTFITASPAGPAEAGPSVPEPAPTQSEIEPDADLRQPGVENLRGPHPDSEALVHVNQRVGVQRIVDVQADDRPGFSGPQHFAKSKIQL